MKQVLYTSNLKWLDYEKLARTVILKNKKFNDLKVNFYTAVNTYKLDSRGKPHKSIKNYGVYKKALEKRGITVIEGRFKPRNEKLNCYLPCPSCNKLNFVHKFKINVSNNVTCYCGTEIEPENASFFKKVEEKKTDVKIAIDIVNAARDGHFNKIYIFSTDSDFIPAIEYVKENCPNVKIYIVAPADKNIERIQKNNVIIDKSSYRYGVSEFENLGTTIIRLKLSKLCHCLFPNSFEGLQNPWN